MARYPINPPINITTHFGVEDPNAYFLRHSGIDLAVATGRQVYAPASGVIWWAGWSPTGGNMVILFDGTYYHRLMHNSVIQVVANQRIVEGQEIALAGATGLAFGPHVHWDIATEMLSSLRPSSFSKFIDPEKWVEQGDNMYPTRERVISVIKNYTGKVATEGDIAYWMKRTSQELDDTMASQRFQRDADRIKLLESQLVNQDYKEVGILEGETIYKKKGK